MIDVLSTIARVHGHTEFRATCTLLHALAGYQREPRMKCAGALRLREDSSDFHAHTLALVINLCRDMTFWIKPRSPMVYFDNREKVARCALGHCFYPNAQ